MIHHCYYSSRSSFNIYFYLFTYLAALGLGCDKQDLFSCGMWELVP